MPQQRKKKAAKKAAKKTAKKTMSVSATKASTAVKRRPNKGRQIDKKYLPVIDRAMKLKKDQVFTITPPDGVTVATMRQRISSVIDRHVKPQRPKIKFLVFRTDDDLVAVQVL